MDKERLLAVPDGGNDFTKKFLYGDVELYVSKAFDEKSKFHCLLFSIPIIPELGVEQVSYPMEFQTEEYRDEMFEKLDATLIMERIYEQIIKNKELQKHTTSDGN